LPICQDKERNIRKYIVVLRKQQKGNKTTHTVIVEGEWMMRRSSGWKIAKDEQHTCLVIGRHKNSYDIGS